MPRSIFWIAALLAAGLLVGTASARAAAPGCETRVLEKKTDLTEVASRLTTGSKILAGTGATVLFVGELAGGKLVKIVGSAEVAVAGILDLVAYYYPPGTTVTACANNEGGPAVIGLQPDVVANLARLAHDAAPQVAGTVPKSALTAPSASLDQHPSLAALTPFHPLVGHSGLTWASLAAASVSGVVKDAATGAPLPQATIRLTGLGISQETVTEADGSYRFGAVFPGDYAIAVENAGYLPQKSAVTVTADHSAYTANFAIPSAYPCDFHVHNESGGTLVFWYDEPDGPHLAAIIDPDKSVAIRGMPRPLRVSAEVLSPRLRWHDLPIVCGSGNLLSFPPAPATR